ncbi:MAG: UDP-N-acetylmuramoyl-L-alanyl-D-glutamate--2,6-diaminopimelate ligase [Candidatus Sumerlaeota bacterium]|nr:UDP-N-acetylmuramoyl-L-alanyl-D-glutamate--2,6-diaminopimelate ligase [Candidatus Sumerlaeota bacterium]
MTSFQLPVPLIEVLDRAHIKNVDIQGNPQVMVTGVATHAQKTERNQLFVARVGTKVDSHVLVSEAVQRGACALLVERDIPPYPGVTIVRVKDTQKALGPVAHAFYRDPAREMKIIATTGTNGKTSVTRLVGAILRTAGMPTGTIGTLGAEWKNRCLQSDTTTPDPVTIARTMRMMRADGIEAVSLEASSHAIDQNRIGGLPINVGILTNVTQDHLDYHGDFPTYIAVKRRLFFEHVAKTPGGIACFNEKDPVGEELCFSYKSPFLRYTEYESAETNVTARNLRLGPDGTSFDLLIEGGTASVASRLVGRFNVSNMLAAAAAAHALGIGVEAIARGLSLASPIPGRFERLDEGQPFSVIVDYAHTPDALEKLLKSVRQLTAGKVITVAGCGGDRDRTKRYAMGAAVAMNSDAVIATSDNPRYEDPDRIASEMLVGITESGVKTSQVQTVLDRAHAIERALHLAQKGDTVVIAGKGHEPYQEICGVRYAFDDCVVTRGILRAMSANWSTNPTAVEFRSTTAI